MPAFAAAYCGCSGHADTVPATASRTGSTSCGSPAYHARPTSAPACANTRAVAAPMPDAAPVITATLPVKSNMVSLPIGPLEHHVAAVGTERLPHVVRRLVG